MIITFIKNSYFEDIKLSTKMMQYLKEKDLKTIYEKIVQDNDADRPYHEKDIEYIIE